jgi:hypothetical protein
VPQDDVEVTIGIGERPDADVDEERAAAGQQAVGAAHRRDLAEGLQLAGDAQAARRANIPSTSVSLGAPVGRASAS